MTFRQEESAETVLSKRERIGIITILSTVALLTAIDVYEDWIEGAALSHIIPEVFVIIFATGIGLYLMIRALRARKKVLDRAEEELQTARDAAQEWQATAQSLSQGITEAITAQFQSWGLTSAEQEVGFLLLKGLSIQEVATIRETSERTVRQQASEIYKKSGLSGRAQLSAFFLEDLFSGNNFSGNES